MENNKGIINICSLQDMKNYKTEFNVMATRFMSNKISDVYHIPDLGPSIQLFNLLKSTKNKKERYELLEVFRKETQSSSYRNILNTILKYVNLGVNVTIMCYCPRNEWDICHRRILAEEIEKLGYSVNLVKQ